MPDESSSFGCVNPGYDSASDPRAGDRTFVLTITDIEFYKEKI